MRNDIHRPSQIKPSEYRELFPYAYATTEDGRPVPGYNISLLTAQRLGRPFEIGNDMIPGPANPIADKDGKPYPMAACHKGGNCDICGAYHVYGSVLLHEPTGECIAVGHQCAAKMEVAMDLDEIRYMKGQRDLIRLSMVTVAKRRLSLREYVRTTPKLVLEALRVDHPIIRDIRAKLILWAAKGPANLTEKQEALVLKLANEAKNPKPTEVNVPAPISDKRQTVEGTVVSVKWNDWTNQLRLTVKVATEAGVWLANGTCPAALGAGLELGNSGLRGCVVRFDAKLTAGRDPHFAFFKRPTKAQVVKLGEDQRKVLAELKERAWDGYQPIIERMEQLV